MENEASKLFLGRNGKKGKKIEIDFRFRTFNFLKLFSKFVKTRPKRDFFIKPSGISSVEVN